MLLRRYKDIKEPEAKKVEESKAAEKPKPQVKRPTAKKKSESPKPKKG